MTLIKRNGADSYFPSLFDDFFTKDLWPTFRNDMPRWNGNVPSVNIREDENAFHIELAAPGLKKEDFKVELNKNLLTISVEKETQNEEKDNNGRYTRREFGYTSFNRSFTLSEDVIDADNIAARYEDGVLHLDLPKNPASKTKPVKQIAIS